MKIYTQNTKAGEWQNIYKIPMTFFPFEKELNKNQEKNCKEMRAGAKNKKTLYLLWHGADLWQFIFCSLFIFCTSPKTFIKV